MDGERSRKRAPAGSRHRAITSSSSSTGDAPISAAPTAGVPRGSAPITSSAPATMGSTTPVAPSSPGRRRGRSTGSRRSLTAVNSLCSIKTFVSASLRKSRYRQPSVERGGTEMQLPLHRPSSLPAALRHVHRPAFSRSVARPPVLAPSAIAGWLNQRTGLGAFWRAIFLRRVPPGLTWWYSLGAATLFVFVNQAITGILLAMNYSATPETAYDSVVYISREVPFGWFIRGLHHWGASAMVVLVVLHLVSVFVLAAHRYPREATWLIGVLLLLITLGFGFTGYLLPWDQKAYWATTVGTNIAGTVPLIGSYLVRLLRGGTELGAVALARFYAVHVLVLPLAIVALLTAHLALVIYH